MPVLIRRALCSLPFAACLSIATPAAWAQDSDAHSREVRAIIEAQLAAFQSDDGEKAFSYASPSIREMFGTAERFMAMVRDGYPVVYRPASVAFLVPEVVDADLIQRVRMTDRTGAAWLAVYHMQRQPDRSWRINGCVIRRDDARTAALH